MPSMKSILIAFHSKVKMSINLSRMSENIHMNEKTVTLHLQEEVGGAHVGTRKYTINLTECSHLAQQAASQRFYSACFHRYEEGVAT
jgi:hypothetical protein